MQGLAVSSFMATDRGHAESAASHVAVVPANIAVVPDTAQRWPLRNATKIAYVTSPVQLIRSKRFGDA